MIRQQDGPQPYGARNVRAFLDVKFTMWIGRRGSVEWPLKSTDYSFSDFSVWGI